LFTTTQPDDKRIAENILTALEQGPFLDTVSVDVQVKNGAVSLSGTVASLSVRRAAYEIALRTAGVTAIHDQLTVDELSTDTGRLQHAQDD
jgi:osmotically-inducible protein OsmY